MYFARKTPHFSHLPLVTAVLLLIPFVTGAQAATDSCEMLPDSPVQDAFFGDIPVWQNNDTIKFKLPPEATTPESQPLYVRITYLDEGNGRLQVAYRNSEENWVGTEIHTRSSRIGSGKLVDSYHELRTPANDNVDSLLRVRILQPDGTPLSIKNVTLQDTPFDNQDFLTVLAAPWKEAPNFPPDPSAPRTLAGTIMVGYQGWFRTPNDRDDIGWRHWLHPATRQKPVGFGIDMWPDMNDYPTSAWVPAAGVTTQSGKPAFLFSSTSPEVVDRHFQWMREYNIDGAFLQRFMGHREGGDDGQPEWVLHAVRQAANREKRLWAIEYDVSGLKNETALEVLERDWSWLVDTLKIHDDPYYAREDGKPVVFIWGLPVSNRGFRPEIANEIVDFFKNNPKYGGNYVIGGIPGAWRKLSPEWHAHIAHYDSVLTWQGRRHDENVEAFEKIGVKYYPHVWPGFSWAHLKGAPEQYTSRDGGRFYWDLITSAVKAGGDRLFVGMFDEYDESTAIIPMTDDPPHPRPINGRFLTNEGLPSTWWLTLTSHARELLQGQRTVDDPMPEPPLATTTN